MLGLSRRPPNLISLHTLGPLDLRLLYALCATAAHLSQSASLAPLYWLDLRWTETRRACPSKFREWPCTTSAAELELSLTFYCASRGSTMAPLPSSAARTDLALRIRWLD